MLTMELHFPKTCSILSGRCDESLGKCNDFLRERWGLGRAIARQNPCLFGLNFSSCVASSGFFHLPKRKTPENKPFNVRLPWGFG